MEGGVEGEGGVVAAELGVLRGTCRPTAVGKKKQTVICTQL